jgi:glycosyltransferase involved in cell wall biosynthesis
VTESELPLVSVIIPTYNRGDLVTKAISSVINQTYKNLEILVVDDGSTDNTSEILKKISQNHENLVYLHKPNGGCASARNKGLENARGDYFSFLDSDDQWEQYAVEKMVDTLLSKSVDIVYSPSIEIFTNGKQLINLPVSANHPESLAASHFINTNVRNGSFMFSRAALTKTGFLDESLRFNEDSDFFQRLAINNKAAYLPYPTVRVLNHPGGKSRDRVRIFEALLKSHEKILAQYPDFAIRMGSITDIRRIQICNDLVEALILDKNWDEAISRQKSLHFSPSYIYKISIQLKSSFPTQIYREFRRTAVRINHFLKKIDLPIVTKGEKNDR